jgi:hypothetical protein
LAPVDVHGGWLSLAKLVELCSFVVCSGSEHTLQLFRVFVFLVGMELLETPPT